MRKSFEFHQKLREHILKGFDDQSLGEMNKMLDDLMDEALRESPAMGLSRFSSGLRLSWSESDKGRELIVIPRSPQDKVDVTVENKMIIIKSSRRDGDSVSESTHMQTVPDDCDASAVKTDARDAGLVLLFPWLKGAAPKSLPENRPKPLKTEKKNIDV